MTDPRTLFAILGPIFLLFGLWRLFSAKSRGPQARTWLILGLAFTAVAVWLEWRASAP